MEEWQHIFSIDLLICPFNVMLVIRISKIKKHLIKKRRKYSGRHLNFSSIKYNLRIVLFSSASNVEISQQIIIIYFSVMSKLKLPITFMEPIIHSTDKIKRKMILFAGALAKIV